MTITILTDQTEYSRYHTGQSGDRPDFSIVTATIQVANPVTGTGLSVALFRLDGYGIVCSKSLTLTTATTYIITFDLNRDTYDTKNIYRAKQGDYTVQAADGSGDVLAESARFAVSIVPVWEIKNEWAKGVTFWDYEVLAPRVQPQNITGVTVVEVSENHLKGPFALSYAVDDSPATLLWGGGLPVNINGTAPQSLLLMNSTQDFIMVDVNPLLLPVQSATDNLYIDNGRMKDTAIIDQMRRATDWVNQRIITKVEPIIVDTDPVIGNWADETGIAETFYRPRNQNKWMNFQLPYPNMLDLEKVTGWFNTSQVSIVQREWLVWDERTGIVELVPATSAAVVWAFYNSIFILTFLFNYPSIPSFWHFRLTCGLRDLWNERAIIREAIAKKCCTELLILQGSSYRAGYASRGTSRDGVSQEESYTSSATYGTFAGHFTHYQDWLKTEIPKMKSRFCGILYRTI